MLPLLKFIALVIDLYIWVIIGGAILSWLIAFNVVNTQNKFVYMVGDTLNRLTEPANSSAMVVLVVCAIGFEHTSSMPVSGPPVNSSTRLWFGFSRKAPRREV